MFNKNKLIIETSVGFIYLFLAQIATMSSSNNDHFQVFSNHYTKFFWVLKNRKDPLPLTPT
jgi:hypothetical protein